MEWVGSFSSPAALFWSSFPIKTILSFILMLGMYSLNSRRKLPLDSIRSWTRPKLTCAASLLPTYFHTSYPTVSRHFFAFWPQCNFQALVFCLEDKEAVYLLTSLPLCLQLFFGIGVLQCCASFSYTRNESAVCTHIPSLRDLLPLTPIPRGYNRNARLIIISRH